MMPTAARMKTVTGDQPSNCGHESEWQCQQQDGQWVVGEERHKTVHRRALL